MKSLMFVPLFFLAYVPLVWAIMFVSSVPPQSHAGEAYVPSSGVYYDSPEAEWAQEYGYCYYQHCTISLK